MDKIAATYRRFLDGDQNAFDEIIKSQFDKLMFEGVLAPHPYCPHRQVAPVKAALALSLVATSETLQTAFFFL